MVERDLAGRGIEDRLVLEAMSEVPREAFVSPDLRPLAYEDGALPIEEGQTISQPYIVALMTQALELEGGERVLDVGTGSGYQAAVLSRIAAEVWSIERHGRLAELARRRFAELGYANIRVRHGDGTMGWAEGAPYEAILVAAGGPEVPAPLLAQLAIGGRLVIPIGKTRLAQRLVRVVRTGPDEYETTRLEAVRFVPLVGAEGWEDVRSSRTPNPGPETPNPGPEAENPGGETAEPELCQGVREFSHTADLGIEVEAASLEQLFERTGRGMMALLRGSGDAGVRRSAKGPEEESPGGDEGADPSGGRPEEPDRAERGADGRVVDVGAVDLPALLVRWLGELLHFRDEGLAFRGATFERLEEARLRARVRLAPDSRPPIREIKGVTYHGLEVREAEGAWSARVIFDV